VTAAGVGLIALAVAAAILIATSGGGGSSPDHAASPATSASTIDERFAALSSAGSNRCDLGAAELRGMPDHMRLRGSCCFPMDRARYEEQLRDLRGHDRRIVPRDPYDVSVASAKRLLGYLAIALDRRELAAYDRATELSELGGPCCCPCWRWQAFKGQARFLLARRNYGAAEIARLWDSEEGCGGAREQT
jgi:hypothetical protein